MEDDEDICSISTESDITGHDDIDNVDIHIDPSQNQNKFKCNSCDYQCSYEAILKEHMEVHTGDKCNDSKNKESPITDENVNECTECTFRCLSKDEMVIHLTTHKIYACGKCNYRSNSANGLKGHMKKHYDKKFKCSKCDFKGTSLMTLSNHMIKHTGEEICLSPSENENKSSQKVKRDREISVSPEKADLDNNVRRNSSKKVKS